ncbi:MAG: site-2 protease family protein [Actinomycetota bacterium]
MTWVLAFAGFAALIILHEAGHFAAAKAVGMRVERFFLFFPPKIVSVKRGETEYGIGAIPAGGFVKITGMNPDEELPPEVAHRGYYKQPVWKRIVVIAAGPAVNILIAFLILFFLAFDFQQATKSVDSVSSGTPAQGLLRPGDRIVSVDGVRGDQVRIAKQIDSHPCEGKPRDGCLATTPAKVVVKRNGELLTLTVRPRYDAAVGRNRIGFSFATRPLNPSVGQAARESADIMWEVSSKTVSVIARIFDPEERKQVSGVVGTYEVTRQAISFSTQQALFLLAVISLSLGLLNLFPFLPLDGGHIFWSLVEKVRGRPVPFSVMERASAVGFLLVIMLAVIGLTNDINRLTGEGFNVR